MGETVKDALNLFEERGDPVAKIESGYVVFGKTYILCKCDGSGDVGKLRCECGVEAFCCMTCVDNGLIRNCPKCARVYKKRRQEFAKLMGTHWEHAEAKLEEQARLLAMPIDFDCLIAEGKLERVSANEYKLLVPFGELPKHVQEQVTGISSESSKDKDGNTVSQTSVLKFRDR